MQICSDTVTDLHKNTPFMRYSFSEEPGRFIAENRFINRGSILVWMSVAVTLQETARVTVKLIYCTVVCALEMTVHCTVVCALEMTVPAWWTC